MIVECSKCIYWDPEEEDDDYAQCRRLAPRPMPVWVGNSLNGRWCVGY